MKKIMMLSLPAFLAVTLPVWGMRYERMSPVPGSVRDSGLWQQGEITGKVTDPEGLPLPGATVQVKDGNAATSTDLEGRFTLEADPDEVLEISFIGYVTREVPVEGRTELEISLEEDLGKLGEVVVMGYTTTSQRDLTGAAEVVEAEKLTDVTATSMDKMLQGKMSGVYIGNNSGDPAAEPTIRIRGSGTLTAGNNPLVVVDGVIGGMPNPSDIESVTVLKDAAATTLYGARAANGVLVVTTKRGQAGETAINLRANVGTGHLNNGNFRLMETPEYYALQYGAYQRDYNGDDFGEYIQGVLPPELQQVNTNWQDLAFQAAVNQNYELSVRGGSEKTRFYLGGNYYQEDGILRETGIERYSVRLNMDHTVNERFHITGNVAARLVNDENNSNGSLYQSYIKLPWDRPYTEDGRPTDPRVDPWYSRDPTNFLFDQQYNGINSRRFNLEGLLKLEYDLTSWLSVSTSNRAQYYHKREESNNDARTSAGADMQGLLTNGYGYSNTYLSSNLLKFQKDIAGDHHFDGLLGAEFQHFESDTITAVGRGIIPGREVLDVSAQPLEIGGNKAAYAFNSYFVQANYNYQYKYYVTASLRRDGSSRFGRNQQYGNFYAVGLSWQVSDERFMQSIPAITNLKLRTSYGTTGNASIGNYLAVGAYNVSTQYNGIPGAYPAVYDVPDLSWEKAYNTNIGLDLGLWDRINLFVDLYQRDNKDLLFNVPLPANAGYSFITENVGAVRNRGIEIQLATDNLAGELKWSTDFNITFNRNEISELYGGQNDIIDPGNSNFILRKGEDMRSFFLRKWAGVDPANGDPLWERVSIDENGAETVTTTNNYNEATLQIAGRATPKFFGGMGNTFSYKQFELSAFLMFVYGNDVYNIRREYFDNDGAYETFNLMRLHDGWSRWEQEGDMATHPKYVIGGNQNSHRPSARFLEDGSFLRMRNITLSYALPEAWAQHMRLSSVRLSLSADNLFTITNFSGIDPEVDDRGTVVDRYPFARKFLLGLDVNF